MTAVPGPRRAQELLPHDVVRLAAELGVALLALVLLHGCAGWQPPARPDDTALRARAVVQTVGGVQLSAAVLSAAESRMLFGQDVNSAGIQPVWLEVVNPTAEVYWLLRSGTDPDYFSPLEVAWTFHAILDRDGNDAMDRHFDSLAFPNPVSPGATRAGIIFTNPHRGTRILNADLLGRNRMLPFTLFLPVPDDAPGAAVIERLKDRMAAPKDDLLEMDALRATLEQLPCCGAHDATGASGDPVNAVWVGELADIAAAVLRLGYRADRRAPDDDQRVFGRRPDAVVRKAGKGSLPAHWIRFWVAPVTYRGGPVFVTQVGRPVGGRSALSAGGDLMLHPAVDEARNFLTQEMLYSGGLARLGFVEGAGAVGAASPGQGSGGSRYVTDGRRVVMFFVTRPVTLSGVEFLDWAK